MAIPKSNVNPVENDITVTSATQSAEEMARHFDVEASHDPDEGREDDEEDEEGDGESDDKEDDKKPAAKVGDRQPATITPSEAGKALSQSRDDKRISRIKDSVELLADSIREMGGTVPVLEKRSYRNQKAEIDHLTRHRHQIDKVLNDTLKLRKTTPLAEVPKTPQPQARPAPVVTAKKAAEPKKFAFPTWDEYQEKHPEADWSQWSDERSDARETFKDEQRAVAKAAAAAEEAESKVIADATAKAGRAKVSIEAARAKYDDFDDVVAAFKFDMTTDQAQMLSGLLKENHDDAGELVYHLAKTPEDVKALLTAPNGAALMRKFFKVLSAVESNATPAPKKERKSDPDAQASDEPPARKATNAPRPLRSVGGTGADTRSNQQIAEDGEDADEYISVRAEQRRRSGSR